MDVYKGKIPTIWYFAFTDREIDRIVEALAMLKVEYVKSSANSVSHGQDADANMFFDISCEISELKNRIEATREKVANE